ncbi:uncharacterized protein METZ01_LOCUS468385, partial [marine metagenome]
VSTSECEEDWSKAVYGLNWSFYVALV